MICKLVNWFYIAHHQLQLYPSRAVWREKEKEREKLTKINVDSVSDKQHHFEMVLKSFIERGGLWSGIKNRAHTHTHMIYTENKKYFASIRGKILSSYE